MNSFWKTWLRFLLRKGDGEKKIRQNVLHVIIQWKYLCTVVFYSFRRHIPSSKSVTIGHIK